MKKREFIKTASLAIGASVLPLSTWSCEKPKQLLHTAHIGIANMGLEDLKAIASHANVVVTALCDVDSNALKKASELFPEAQIFSDYRIMFDQISDQENFIVVYVQGTTDAFGNTGWNVNVVPTFNLVDDVGLFKALIKYFKANYNIDSSKIFSTGMSLGGFMSYRLACELNEINSIGSVTGSMAGYYDCNPPKKTGTIHFHGTSDGTVPYDGVEWSLSARDAHDFWKVHNSCNSQTEINLPDFNGDGRITKRLISYNCDENKAVEL